MTLELRRFFVNDVQFGARTEFSQGRLTVNVPELQSQLKAHDVRLRNLRIDVAKSGQAKRIVCVKDVIEPRVKIGAGEVAEGKVNALHGLVVVTCGPIVGFQEGIIDMSGPGAAHTPFSQMSLLVLQIEIADSLTARGHEEAIRIAGLRAAEFLARKTVNTPPDEIENITWNESSVNESLPRLAYVYMVLSQGLLHDTYVMGRNAAEGLPIVVDPRLAIAGDVVSGNCVSACDKNTTYHHQNNPIIAELLRGHGKRWNFVGVVITNVATRLGEKETSARRTIELVRQLRADGTVVSKEGFGNPDADMMMIVRGLEQCGTKTVAITDEFAGVDGGSQSLADVTPEADAIVSAGNANARIVLPAMEQTIGPIADVSRLVGGYPHSVRDDGTLEVELQAIIGSTNQLGYGKLSCREV